MIALPLHLGDLLLEIPQAAPDPPPLDLDLLLARPAPGSDSAALAVVVPGADQAGQEVVQLGRLHLEASLVGPRVLGEDVEDQLGPVDDPGFQLPLQVSLLTGAQIFVADQQVIDLRLAQRLQVVELALADEERGIDLRAPLHLGADHLATGGAGQVGQLGQLHGQCLRRGPGQLDGDEVGTLGAGFGRDQIGRPFRRSSASSSRLSGAVTESRK